MMNSQPATPVSRGGDFRAFADARFQLGTLRPEVPKERAEVPAHELVFRHLRSPGEIAQIRYLRGEIQLPDTVRNDPAFADHEKKEMSTVLWVLSNCMGSPLEPFGLYPWAVDSLLVNRSSLVEPRLRRNMLKRRGRSGGLCWRPSTVAVQRH